MANLGLSQPVIDSNPIEKLNLFEVETELKFLRQTIFEERQKREQFNYEHTNLVSYI